MDVDLGQSARAAGELPPPDHPVLGGASDTSDLVLLFHYSRDGWRGDLARGSEMTTHVCATVEEARDAVGIPVGPHSIVRRKLWVSRATMPDWFTNEVAPTRYIDQFQYTLTSDISARYFVDDVIPDDTPPSS
jgi:hypothetical protein